MQVANRDLESFSYSVSHDLRAPLRAINGFTGMIENDHARTLDEQGKALLQRVVAATERMDKLIEALLNLSRIARQGMQVGPVDLSALARDVAAELQAAEPGRKVQTYWTIAPGVQATGDTGLLRLALQNLLGNAFKYRSKRDTGRIEFGVAEKDERPAYFVRDNGAGFDMAYADKLFGAFQRLHSPSEFPGTGIGLATVARIVHRHGGEVWAEGKVGEGSSFYFTL
ncbi:MAG: ATP-binding protein [Sulfuricaulis sp.]|nr:ATP-binding protein [Sulfuricaulis sp.]